MVGGERAARRTIRALHLVGPVGPWAMMASAASDAGEQRLTDALRSGVGGAGGSPARSADRARVVRS
jgi:hypothetical protein